jgi:hypothetical protein
MQSRAVAVRMARSIGFPLFCGGPIVELTIRRPGRPAFLLLDRGPAVVKLPFHRCKEKSMAQVRAKWLAFYSEHVEPVSKEIFSHVEKMIIGTLIVSAGAHVSAQSR